MFKVEVEKELRVQGAIGQLFILPEAVARARFGSRLTIASLNALQKDVAEDGTVTVRVLHVGTTGVNANRFIQVRDACIYPLAPDITMVMRCQSASGKRFWALLVVVSGAHRTVAVREEDWPLQACRLEPGGDVFVNCVGAFGISSAAYWRGRLAAALHRAGLTVVTARWALWAVLFADDWMLAATEPHHRKALLCFLWFLVVWRVLHKAKGGSTFVWVGYELSLRGWTLAISATRAEWAITWMTRTLANKRVDTTELREALGRLVFVYGALRWDRLFLAPLFSFLGLHRPGVVRKLPLLVMVVLSWLRDRLRARRSHVIRTRKVIERALLRVDAKAEGLAVAVGGWCPHPDAHGSNVIGKFRWFSLSLTEATAP